LPTANALISEHHKDTRTFALLCAFAYVIEVFVGYGYSAWGPKFIAKKFNLTPGAAGTGVMF
jgi:hypothetical protein